MVEEAQITSTNFRRAIRDWLMTLQNLRPSPRKQSKSWPMLKQLLPRHKLLFRLMSRNFLQPRRCWRSQKLRRSKSKKNLLPVLLSCSLQTQLPTKKFLLEEELRVQTWAEVEKARQHKIQRLRDQIHSLAERNWPSSFVSPLFVSLLFFCNTPLIK